MRVQESFDKRYLSTFSAPTLNQHQRRILTAQESLKKRRDIRQERLDYSRDLIDDDCMDVATATPASDQLYTEIGDVGGLVCPVCCAHWYMMNYEMNCMICEGCRVPITVGANTTVQELRGAVKAVLRDHNSGCPHLPQMAHLPDNASNSVICVCQACDYLNIVF